MGNWRSIRNWGRRHIRGKTWIDCEMMANLQTKNTLTQYKPTRKKRISFSWRWQYIMFNLRIVFIFDKTWTIRHTYSVFNILCSWYKIVDRNTNDHKVVHLMPCKFFFFEEKCFFFNFFNSAIKQKRVRMINGSHLWSHSRTCFEGHFS